METRKVLLHTLNQTISQLVSTCKKIQGHDPLVYENWSIKDVISHITFWHESFARNVSDLVNEIKPTPLRGKYSDLNDQCFMEFRPLTMKVILSRLQNAHTIIQHNIMNHKIKRIPYKVGSRNYSPEEHLQIVNDHIQSHIKDLLNSINDY